MRVVVTTCYARPTVPKRDHFAGLPDVDATLRESLNPNPLAEKAVTPEQRQRDVATFERAVEGGRRPQDQIYAGPMPNVPQFETVPWKARPETDHGIGVYCPSHLHVFTDDEKLVKHYPNAALDEDGYPTRFCWACGRPCRADGLTGKGHRGNGKPCPVCGFRRKQQKRASALAGLRPGNNGLAPSHVVSNGHGTPEEQRAVRDNSAPVGAPDPLVGPRGGLRRGATVTDLIRERTHEKQEAVVRPYFDALALEPKEEWSPSTKLDFYTAQTNIAEKLLNRVEGLPVARTRHVDKNDDDVMRDDELSPSTLVQLVAAMATGADVDALLGQAEDAEWEPLPKEAA